MNYVTMRSLGHMGRGGNQLFQYAFLRAYCDAHQCQLQVPPWFGNSVFGLTDPPMHENLPIYQERTGTGSTFGQALPLEGDELVGHDFVGWAQWHTSWWTPERRWYWQDLFQPVRPIRERLEPLAQRLREMGDLVVGLHIRRGDYGQSFFPYTPLSWFCRWLDEHWSSLDYPVVLVATEDRNLVEKLAKYHPVTAESLGYRFGRPYQAYNYEPGDANVPYLADWFADWWLLTQADIILASNSTFSFTAGMVSERLRAFWRANLDHRGFILEDVWNTYPFLHQQVHDYPDIKGVRRGEETEANEMEIPA